MSTLSNPLFIQGKYKNLQVAVPSMAGLVSIHKEPFSLAISIADAQRNFDSRANVHREVLADCQGAARVRAGANAIAATTEGVVDMEEGVCDTTQPLVPDGSDDEWEDAEFDFDSYGDVNGRAPLFRTIIPKQTGTDTMYQSVVNRVVQPKLSDRFTGEAVGIMAMQDYRMAGIRDEHLCHKYNIMCGSGATGPNDEARTNAYLN